MSVFFLKNGEDLVVYQVKNGAVVDDLQSLRVECPSKDALMELKKSDLLGLLTSLRLRMPNSARLDKGSIAGQIIKEFGKLKTQASNLGASSSQGYSSASAVEKAEDEKEQAVESEDEKEHAVESEDEKEQAVESEDENTSVESASKSDDDQMSISDFIEIGENGEYVFDVAYLRDGSDFNIIDDGTKICLSEYRGRKLFDLIVNAKAKVYVLKTLIVEHIAEKQPNNKRRLTEEDFYLLVGGEKMQDDETILAYMDDDHYELALTLFLRIRGGGKVPIKKHIVKMSSTPPAKVSQSDMEGFKNAYDTCLEVSNATTIDFEKVLKVSSAEALLSMKEFLKSSTTSTLKVHGVCEHTDYWKVIHSTQEKLIGTAENLRTMIKQDLGARFENNIEKIKEAVSNAYGVKLAFAQAQNAQMTD